MFSQSRLKQFAFERLSTWVLASLLLVWSLANAVGLRNALMVLFILMAFENIVRTKKIMPGIPTGLKLLLLVFFLHTSVSLFLSIDFQYSKQRWWADYGAPVLLALGAVQFARQLDYKLILGAIFAGLLVNGIVDGWQVYRFMDNTEWRGVFSDYGWENGFLLLSLPLILSVFTFDHHFSTGRAGFSFFMVAFACGFMASLSSWARANQLCFMAAMILALSVLVCQRSGEGRFRMRLLVFYVVMGGMAIIFRFLPSCFWMGPITSLEFVLAGLLIPMVFFVVPAGFRKRFVPAVIIVVVMTSILGLIILYQMAGLKKTHSELVRKFSYQEVAHNAGVVPFFGFGPGRDIVFDGIPSWLPRMNEYVYPQINCPIPVEVPMDHGRIRGHSHIQWINWRFELGYPGLVMIVGLIGYSLYLLLKMMLANRYGPVNLALGSCLLAFTLNIFMGQLFNAGFAQQFWVMWALFIANSAGSLKDNRTT